MRTIILLLACLACTGHAWRLQPGAGLAPRVPSLSGNGDLMKQMVPLMAEQASAADASAELDEAKEALAAAEMQRDEAKAALAAAEMQREVDVQKIHAYYLEQVAALKAMPAPEPAAELAAVKDTRPSSASSVKARVWFKDAKGLANVVVVGAGVPKRGMGWYHAKQIIDGDVPSARLTAVVEPWFLGAGADSEAGAVFKEWADVETKNGVGFYSSVADLPKPDGPTLALISGRTADNPRLLKEVIEAGCTHVFLEKPGAPTVGELEDMKKFAAEKGVPVWMGYNKNVASYVLDALEEQKKTEGSSMTFIHNNAYKEEELPECFERNAEGMLKNMAIHELALLATYYGVTVDNIDSVSADKDYSSCQTLKGPGGDEFTDFAKVGFTVKTKDGKSVTVKSDRCGCNEGGNSVAIVSVGGEEKFSTKTPDQDLQAVVEEKAKADPDMMPYFFLQSDDYVTLKERCTAHMVAGKEGAPEGLATLDIGIDALKVAEYLTPLLQDATK